MADRLQYNAPSVFTEKTREVSYADGTVDVMNQLSGAFLHVANKAHQAELKSLVAQAKKDGALEGSKQGMAFRPIKGRGVVHQVYNDSGIQTATIKMSSNSQQAIQRIALQNPGSPGAQKQAMEKWADAFAEDLPEGLVQPFRSNFDQLALSQLTLANKELSKIRQSEAVAQYNDYEQTVTNSVEMYAPNMFEPGEVGTDAAKAIEVLRKNFIETTAQNGPSLEYSVGGYKIPAGSGRTNAFSIEQIGRKIAEFDKMVLGAAVKGDFLRELEAGRGVATYFNFVKGNTALTTVGADGQISQVSVDSVLNNEDKAKLSSFMRTHMTTLNSLEQAQDRKADRAKDQFNEAILDQAVASAFTVVTQKDGSQIVQGNPDLLRMQYLSAVNDQSGLVRLETVEGLQSLMETVGTGDIADPVVVPKTKLGIITREIKNISQLPKSGLGDKERGAAVQLIRQINAGQHWSNSQRYQTMITLGQASLAPEAATGFALFSDPNKESAADFAEFKETLMSEIMSAEQAGTLPTDINALPSKDEFDVQTRAREIIKEIKDRKKIKETDPEVEALNTQIKDLNATLNNSETTNVQAKKARNELKRAMDEKSRIQSNKTFQTIGNR